MLTPEKEQLLKDYFDKDVTFAFKRGLWELQKIPAKTDGAVWELRRFKGYKSPEVVTSIQFRADTPEALIAAMSKVKYSGRERKIVGV